jgi:hypothetical protein
MFESVRFTIAEFTEPTPEAFKDPRLLSLCHHGHQLPPGGVRPRDLPTQGQRRGRCGQGSLRQGVRVGWLIEGSWGSPDQALRFHLDPLEKFGLFGLGQSSRASAMA